MAVDSLFSRHGFIALSLGDSMNRQFVEFKSLTGTPHKVPVPFKDPKDCTHEQWAGYSFDMMKPPTCWDCGKESEGKQASDALNFYQKLIDDANAKAQEQYDNSGSAFFYVKNTDGSYYKEYKRKQRKTILGILYDVFIDEPREKSIFKELGL
jgi:hypothetical protein